MSTHSFNGNLSIAKDYRIAGPPANAGKSENGYVIV